MKIAYRSECSVPGHRLIFPSFVWLDRPDEDREGHGFSRADKNHPKGRALAPEVVSFRLSSHFSREDVERGITDMLWIAALLQFCSNCQKLPGWVVRFREWLNIFKSQKVHSVIGKGSDHLRPVLRLGGCQSQEVDIGTLLRREQLAAVAWDDPNDSDPYHRGSSFQFHSARALTQPRRRLFVSAGYRPFCSPIHLLVRASSISSGRVPPSRISSWNLRISNFGPNSFCARSRSSRILSCPSL